MTDTPTITNELKNAAALADLIYRRADSDQSVK